MMLCDALHFDIAERGCLALPDQSPLDLTQVITQVQHAAWYVFWKLEEYEAL